MYDFSTDATILVYKKLMIITQGEPALDEPPRGCLISHLRRVEFVATIRQQSSTFLRLQHPNELFMAFGPAVAKVLLKSVQASTIKQRFPCSAGIHYWTKYEFLS